VNPELLRSTRSLVHWRGECPAWSGARFHTNEHLVCATDRPIGVVGRPSRVTGQLPRATESLLRVTAQLPRATESLLRVTAQLLRVTECLLRVTAPLLRAT
jgi:hypothetical protein